MMPLRIALASAIMFSSLGHAQSPSPEKPAEQKAHDQREPDQNDSKARPEISPKSDDKPQGRAAVQKKEDGPWSKFIEWTEHNDKAVVAISTVVIAAFTFALFVATFLLWWAGERHSERELRAYVFISRGSVHNFRIGARMVARLEIQNTGRTPAYEVGCTVRFELARLPRGEFLHGENVDRFTSKSTLAAGQCVDTTGIFPVDLTEEAHTEIINGTLAPFVFGTINYRDAFKKLRDTHFRMAFVGDGGQPRGPENQLLLTPMDQGNEAT
jgi:hypothetical protein